MDEDRQEKDVLYPPTSELPIEDSSELINASGHVQELDRNFSLLSLAGVGLVNGNVWPALGGSILTSLFNGGPPGVLYEFIVVSVFYWIVAACLAELASAIPSSGGVYHWASITPGRRWGRAVGFFAGWWNLLAWIFGAASMSAIMGNLCTQLYAVHHPGFDVQPWMVFVTYIIVSWAACLTVCLGNRFLPYLNTLGLVFIIAGLLITVIIVAVMPSRGGQPGHASSDFVWKDWQADIGYPDGFVFLIGMLNGAFSVGTPDCVSHLAEEVGNPGINVPKAIALQMGIGFVTGLCYLIAILYSINNFDALFDSPFPIADIYHQATNSTAATTGLLMVLFFPILLCITGVFIVNGRTFWALARDGAVPFPTFFGRVNHKFGMPFNATIACGIIVSLLGCIYVGSTTAFNAIIGCFVILTTASYVATILPHLLTRRRNIVAGPFYMKGLFGDMMHAISVLYIVTFIVIYCFPYALPTDAKSMNYSSLMFGGLTLFVACWWFSGPMRNGKYVGPQTMGGTGGEAENRKRVNMEII